VVSYLISAIYQQNVGFLNLDPEHPLSVKTLNCEGIPDVGVLTDQIIITCSFDDLSGCFLLSAASTFDLFGMIRHSANNFAPATNGGTLCYCLIVLGCCFFLIHSVHVYDSCFISNIPAQDGGSKINPRCPE
jgi:hypothetical protein